MRHRILDRLTPLTLVLTLLTVGCGRPAGDEAASPQEGAAPAVEGGLVEPVEVEWSYEGETGPEHWGSLTPAYAACSEGMKQSPIAIRRLEARTVDLADITLDYHETHLNLVNTGHTVQMNYDAGSRLLLDDLSFALREVHFHTPSEHTLEGEYFPMEMHLVHIDSGGNLAVVGVLIAEGKENPAFQRLVEILPTEVGEEHRVEYEDFSVEPLLPRARSYYRYEGSLTTPRCDEGVLWLVLRQPVELSQDQIGAFGTVMHNNSRPLQPRNGRVVLVDLDERGQ